MIYKMRETKYNILRNRTEKFEEKYREIRN